MNKSIENISGLFRIEKFKNDKRIAVFSICLLIATSLWFLNALSKNYNTTVSYPIKFVNPPKNQFLANQPPNKFEFNVEAYGFTLLRHKLSLSFSPIVLNLSNITKDLESNQGEFTIYSKNLIRKISDQVSSEISITDIQPEVFKIVLDSLRTKTVPVRINLSTSFKPQFNLKYPVSAVPNMIKITGPSAVLDTIFAINTRHKEFHKLDASFEKTVELEFPEQISISPEKVNLKIDVERFTEKELKIPIKVLNKPENVSIKLFPSETKILFTIGLSEFDKIKPADFNAYVDYNSIESGIDNLTVKIDKNPGFIEFIRFNPEKIEFLVEAE